MERPLATLKLMLDALGIPPKIDSREDRKVVQKAIYLGQRARVDLGYRYGWYLYGPYSPSLARDYFAMRDRLSVGDSAGDLALNQAASERLGVVRWLMKAPDGTALPQPDWLELVASLDFQRAVLKRTPEQAREAIRTEKPTLYAHVAVAEDALARANLG